MHREQVTHHHLPCIIVSVTIVRWTSVVPRSPATMVLVHAGGKSLASFRGFPPSSHKAEKGQLTVQDEEEIHYFS